MSEGGITLTNDQSYLRILTANANIHQHIAAILEAKAKEMSKASVWTRLHTHSSMYQEQSVQYQDGLRINEKLIEVIEGITKVESGLARHLKMALNPDRTDEQSASDSDLGNLFDL